SPTWAAACRTSRSATRRRWRWRRRRRPARCLCWRRSWPGWRFDMGTRTGTDDARIALACLDLTSLNDDDTDAVVDALCERASRRHVPVAALCVWPRFARLARDRVAPAVKVAAVANFPEGTIDVQRTRREVGGSLQGGWRGVRLCDAHGGAGAAEGRGAARRGWTWCPPPGG